MSQSVDDALLVEDAVRIDQAVDQFSGGRGNGHEGDSKREVGDCRGPQNRGGPSDPVARRRDAGHRAFVRSEVCAFHAIIPKTTDRRTLAATYVWADGTGRPVLESSNSVKA